jgi:chloramphenicol O-acetyltransferase type B
MENNMASTYKVIDEKDWKRALHCQVFRNSLEPAFCITVEMDITNFRKKIKEKGYSFTFSLIYAVTKCANDIEEFKYRFLDGNVVLFDQINTAFTYLNKDTELFKVVNVEMKETLEVYVFAAEKAVKEQKKYFTGPLGNDVFQFSPLPWVTYTHISHTNSGKKENATPLFDWGKFYERDGKMILPFSIQAHHSFVDGIHIGKLVDSLQNYLNQL